MRERRNVLGGRIGESERVLNFIDYSTSTYNTVVTAWLKGSPVELACSKSFIVVMFEHCSDALEKQRMQRVIMHGIVPWSVLGFTGQCGE